MAELRVGTSGYAYKEWKGSFYPKKLPDKQMLHFYSRALQTVEINYTFYRMPTEKILARWIDTVPAEFQFALKMNQKVTHLQRLRDADAILKRFLEVASILEQRLGPILVQLPPSFRADPDLLQSFLDQRPPAFRFAFEVRHPSWQSEETYALLRKHNVALCLAETNSATPPEVLTGDFTYVRLRRESYTRKQLAAWKKRFEDWRGKGIDVYVYVKHEDAGKAPAYARQLLSRKARRLCSPSARHLPTG